MIHPLKQHIDEISPLSDDDFTYVLTHFTPLKRKKHQFLIEENVPVGNDYWVIKGCLKAYLIDAEGKEHILQFAMENWWITDYNAYYNKENSTIFISCLEDCELLSISRENHEKVCREMHAMEHFWARKSSRGYVALQKRILSLLKNSAKERYEQLMKQYPQLLQRVPKKMIASYLGVSRETLSRFSEVS